MPSITTLEDYARSMMTSAASEGKVSPVALDIVSSNLGVSHHCLLVQDAMVIKKGICYNERTKRVDGYSEVESLSELLKCEWRLGLMCTPLL